jgi:hypothetical protein
MKLEGKFKFNAPREKVWKFFMDPKTLAKCIPGCEKLEEKGENSYEATLKIGISVVKGRYTGKVELKDIVAPSHYRLVGEGSGLPGFVKGEAIIDLEEEDGKTAVKWKSDAQIGGLIAGVGQRMISGVAKILTNQFFKDMEKEIKREESL